MASRSEKSAKSKESAGLNAETVLHWILAGALAGVFALEFVPSLQFPFLDAVLLVLATAVMISSLTRQVPLQNVALGLAITIVLGTAAHGISAIRGFGIPFGPLFFHQNCGTQILSFIPWTIPLLWIVVLFSSRGTARVILRPWRKLKSYGYWLIGLTAILVLAFDLTLEPFAVSVKNYWSWTFTKLPLNWYGASPLCYFGWACVSLLILGFATPALIKKKPGSRTPLDLNPLFIWVGAIILFAVGCAKAALWPAVGMDAGILLVTLIFAIRGACW